MKRSERSDAEIQLSKQVVQTFPKTSIATAALSSSRISILIPFHSRLANTAHYRAPYNSFRGAPVISAASLAAVDGGRCSLSIA